MLIPWYKDYGALTPIPVVLSIFKSFFQQIDIIFLWSVGVNSG